MMSNTHNQHSSTLLELDDSVPRQNESRTHWAGKAAISQRLKSDPQLSGTVTPEKKVEDLIADLRCEFSQTPEDWPQRCVVEVQTKYSDKHIPQRTKRYLCYGYAVFWVFDIEASADRRAAEDALAEHMKTRPSLGLISVADGELDLGVAITRDEFDYDRPQIPYNELYVPTHDRYASFFDHGDFADADGRYTIYSNAQGTYWVSLISDDGQRTLPQKGLMTLKALYRRIMNEDFRRISPVRGPPSDSE